MRQAPWLLRQVLPLREGAWSVDAQGWLDHAQEYAKRQSVAACVCGVVASAALMLSVQGYWPAEVLAPVALTVFVALLAAYGFSMRLVDVKHRWMQAWADVERVDDVARKARQSRPPRWWV